MHYFTSDWHLGHTNVLDFCKRPFSNIEEMTETLIQRTNAIVKPTDTLWMLGDFIWVMNNTQKREIISRIKCPIILVKGNHDHKLSSNDGFAGVVDYAVISMGKTQVSLSHYPLRPNLWSQWMRRLQGRPSVRFFDRCPLPHQDCWHLHGHVHSTEQYSGRFGKQIHVGVDAWDYGVVSQNKILEIISKS